MNILDKNEFATFDRHAATWQEALQEIILVPNSTIVLIRDQCSGRH